MTGKLLRQENIAQLEHGQLVNLSRSGIRGKFLNHSVVPEFFHWLMNQVSKNVFTARVDLQKVTYHSQDAAGHKAILSGLVITPVAATTDPAGPMLLAFQHGTQLERRLAPSNFNPANALDFVEVLIAALFAMAGYTVVMADYPGLGIDPGDHPYVNAHPLAISVADLLTAVQHEHYRRTGLAGNRVSLIGYSEGGYATMAVARELQLNPVYAAKFQVAAAAPLAGPYDLSGTMRRLMLRETKYENGYYLPLTIRGYHAVYGDSYGDGIFTKERALKPQYQFLYDLVDGYHPYAEVQKYLPAIPRVILAQPLLDSLQDPASPAFCALAANDLYDWAPEMPMYLYHHPADDQVPFANSVIASEHFIRQGRMVPTVPMFALPLPGSIHGSAAPVCFLASSVWLKLYQSSA